MLVTVGLGVTVCVLVTVWLGVTTCVLVAVASGDAVIIIVGVCVKSGITVAVGDGVSVPSGDDVFAIWMSGRNICESSKLGICGLLELES